MFHRQNAALMRDLTSPSSQPSMWQQLLNDYTPSKTDKKDGHLLILGHPGSGARSLMARLQENDLGDTYKGLAAEYDFFPVRNAEDEDPAGLMHVWHLESPQYSEMLQVALTPERLCNTIVVIVADLTLPHTIMDRVTEWYQRLEKHVKEVVAPDEPLAKALELRVQGYLAKFQYQQKKEAMQATGKAAGGTQSAGVEPGMEEEVLSAHPLLWHPISHLVHAPMAPDSGVAPGHCRCSRGSCWCWC